MTATAPGPTFPFPRRHFLSILDLDPPDVASLLDLADGFVALMLANLVAAFTAGFALAGATAVPGAAAVHIGAAAATAP